MSETIHPSGYAIRNPWMPKATKVEPGTFINHEGKVVVDESDNRNRSYIIKDSGKRESFDSGMVRDTQDGKVEYDRVFDGPMLDRWAEHLTKGAAKYPDSPDGSPNWMKANSEAELRRFRKSAIRHFRQWLRGDMDEDHAAGVFFNINGYEYVKEKLGKQSTNPLANAAAYGTVQAGGLPNAKPRHPYLIDVDRIT